MADFTSLSDLFEGNRSEAESASPKPGLVICAITPRLDHSGAKKPENPGFSKIPDTVPLGILHARFPSPELVSAAAASFTRPLPKWDGSEGPRARIEIAPGMIRIGRTDLNKLEKRLERATVKRLRSVPEVPLVDEPGLRSSVSAWSKKSRARMVHTIASLDLREFSVTADGIPAMVTLTLPGDWLTVAPTAVEYVKMIEAFKMRYLRAWGAPIRGIWKREFQRRGAPHTHIFMVAPRGIVGGDHFPAWLSKTWADVVAHPDPDERARHEKAGTGVDFAEGLRSTDPRRVAVYFTKHSSANFGDKEYQHIVPEEWQASAGRFWGFWGLEKVIATVELPLYDSIELARVLRRHARAQGTTREERVWRSGRFRNVRRRVARLSSSAGFLCVNDGPSFAWQLARFLDIRTQQASESKT